MTEVEQPPQNGIDPTAGEDDDNSKARPADIEQDMREMERRKRVEAIMGSKLFREELERIVDSARDGGAGASGILQQLSDIVGVPVSRVGSVFKSSNCMVPINDIRGVESMGYAKGEKILRCKLAATFRLLDLYGWTQGLGAQITARLKVDQEYFLVNPYGLLYHEITASALNKVDMQGQIVEQGTTNFGGNKSHFVLHSVVHAARPDIRCAIYIGCSPVVAISSLKTGLLPLTKDACVLGEITTHAYTGLFDEEERNRLVRSLGPNSKVILLANHGALCCGETIEEAFFAACHIVQACETQLKLLPVGLDNLVLIPEESRKAIYEQSRRPPEDLEKKFAAVSAGEDGAAEAAEAAVPKVGSPPKWRVGGAEFEALMRMLDNAGYRTGYIYRHPLIKSDPPKPKNDVELPPAVSSLGYLLEEEELFRQGIWKKGDIRKGGDRSRWLNSPNVYQKVEVLETGTPDPKKITKWVAEGSPTHSTPVRIEDPLQFVPAGTNPREFKRVQQLIKDNRRADKISAGPQSHILEGVTWDEASRLKDATVSQTGDHVVMMGAASKGIIQRGFQHNATVYKAPYAKNPFDNVTDDELNEYKRTVERKKKSVHGEYTDTDFSESEAVLQAGTKKYPQSEPETEHQVIEIQTQQAPVPRQAEVVLSDALIFHLAQKYAFLYSPRHYMNASLKIGQLEQKIYVIHKVEPVSKHNYPPVHDGNMSIHHDGNVTGFVGNEISFVSSTPIRNQIASVSLPEERNQSVTGFSSTPYRTISHFGFNCPLITSPTILLHPEHRSIWQRVAEQREKVVSFIDLTTLSLDNRKLLNVVTATQPPTQSHCNWAQSQSQSFVSEKHIQLEVTPPKRKQRIYSATTSSGLDVDSMDELESLMGGLAINMPRRREEDSGLYRSYTFLPSNHVLPENTDNNDREQADRERPEAEQEEGFRCTGDSGLGETSGRRPRLTTTSNDSSTQEAEAYTHGKHIKLTLSSSPTPTTTTTQSPATIEILINVSLRNAECVQTHEQEFRAKLERVIDEEIHYISQQLAFKQRQAELLHQQPLTRAPLATPPTTSMPPPAPPSSLSLVQRSNSAPELCHTYSYVAVGDFPTKPVQDSPPLPVDGEPLNDIISSLEKELERLLNSVVTAHMLHKNAIIHECRARISQLAEGLAMS
ncbi:protein hu-li tai shao isoform X1 [Drosophila eugracilis]|uniref:protein hu-li tai shao isoform X1 n=1 Tax=Drosophila eugracilis TaxID=29029 RepID=UPI0007E701CB|nr:protein hu-li tai shao isoform X1 [Drosophila eugracilis]XP_017072836.1 protein hu-li tai shao isoform X1 [Drosophila eugracilis]XP_017072837.1 protein hu-li tai shao isoform X1 [Drosophila eugracilis]XP_017072838.1 protein hu-li tai shao isoform X1 [Drosophila eugracilis]XP_017072839.1 protein hu-li tai shao isoform X1 [Drosophila eugracilis]XP_017072841.1 protein hu-li tai shao isoform X1 [Drosophila eugracilis]XP_041675845.1 protein hu-li tai shao isoform X1 [Drosophila eugracilis]